MQKGVHTALLFQLIALLLLGSSLHCTGQPRSAKNGSILKKEVATNPGVAPPGDVFEPVLPHIDSLGPQTGAYTLTAGPDENMVISGFRFSAFSDERQGMDTRFTIFAEAGFVKDAAIRRLEEDKAFVTLPQDLPQWSFYLMVPANNFGYGAPLHINKTEAWWLQEQATPGMRISAYGRNLAHGNEPGKNNAHVYIKSKKTGKGFWAQVASVNPYRVNFDLPVDLKTGHYEVWLHNGHGGKWGWSEPLNLKVLQADQHMLAPFRGGQLNVKDFGAAGNGLANDLPAINKALEAAGNKGATVYFPPGTYVVNGTLNISGNTRLQGQTAPDGNPLSIISAATGVKVLIKAQDKDRLLFENLVFSGDGQNTENIELLQFFNCRMIGIKNCAVKVKNGDGIRFQGGRTRDVYLHKSQFTGGVNQWGKVMYLDDVRQFFADSCTFLMTNDCGAAILNRGVSDAALTNSVIADLNSNTEDGSGWGKGRIWAAAGVGGSQEHQYFEGNWGKGLGTRTSGPLLPDNNSGEVFLWEANVTTYMGSPMLATPNTITLKEAPSGKGPDGVERLLGIFIYEGKGSGQFRKVVAKNGNHLTIDQPWGIVPDTSSRVGVGMYASKIVLYQNKIDAAGKPFIAKSPRHTASAGIEPYGGCFDFVADGNSFSNLRRGIALFSHGTWKKNGMLPNYFHLYTNNVMENCRFGIYNGALNEHPEGYAMLGIVYRKNKIISPVVAAVQNEVKYGNSPLFRFFVYEHNNMLQAPAGFQTASMYTQNPLEDWGANAFDNLLFYKNKFHGRQEAIRSTPRMVQVHNSFEGFAQNFWGAKKTGELEIPHRVLVLRPSGNNEAEGFFTLSNVGIAPLSWQATTSASWLSLPKDSGNLQPGEEKILIKANLSDLPPGKLQGQVIINYGAGNKKILSVMVQPQHGPPTPKNRKQ